MLVFSNSSNSSQILILQKMQQKFNPNAVKFHSASQWLQASLLQENFAVVAIQLVTTKAFLSFVMSISLLNLQHISCNYHCKSHKLSKKLFVFDLIRLSFAKIKCIHFACALFDVDILWYYTVSPEKSQLIVRSSLALGAAWSMKIWNFNKFSTKLLPQTLEIHEYLANFPTLCR